MRGRGLALGLAMALLLTGCGRTPQSREAGNTAVIGVLGVESQGADLTLYAAAEGRNGQPPSIYQGKGGAPAAALEDLATSGDAVVSYAHVEHVLLAQTALGKLEDVVSYAFQDLRQSTETQLWVVRSAKLDGVFSGKKDPVRRMSVWKAAGKDKQAFRPVTLREAAGALAEGDAILLPVLVPAQEGLERDGFALYHRGTIAAWLTGEAALGASLLMGDPIHWTESLGSGAVSLRSTGCQVEPVWSGASLTGLALTCRLEGVLTGGWQTQEPEITRLETKVARAIGTALKELQAVGVDAAGLKDRAGLRELATWQTLSRQWDEVYPDLVPQITVRITLAES